MEEIRNSDPTRLYTYSFFLIQIFTLEKKIIVLENLIIEFIKKYPENSVLYLFMSEICSSLGRIEKRNDWLVKCQNVAKELKDEDLFWHCQNLLEFHDKEY